jgi:uncharacterized protein (UPF0333 family)
MKSSIKAAFKLGVFATITVAGTVIYYLRRNNETVGTVLDKSLDSLENAAYEANAAFKDAQIYAQNRARNVYKNVNYHAENLGDDVKEGIDFIGNEYRNVAKDIKKNVEKRV